MIDDDDIIFVYLFLGDLIFVGELYFWENHIFLGYILGKIYFLGEINFLL